MRSEMRQRRGIGAVRFGTFLVGAFASTAVLPAQSCNGGGGGGSMMGGGPGNGAGGGGIAGGTLDVGTAIQLSQMVQQAQQARAAQLVQAQRMAIARRQQLQAEAAARFERYKEIRRTARERTEIRSSRPSEWSELSSDAPKPERRWRYVVFGRA